MVLDLAAVRQRGQGRTQAGRRGRHHREGHLRHAEEGGGMSERAGPSGARARRQLSGSGSRDEGDDHAGIQQHRWEAWQQRLM